MCNPGHTYNFSINPLSSEDPDCSYHYENLWTAPVGWSINGGGNTFFGHNNSVSLIATPKYSSWKLQHFGTINYPQQWYPKCLVQHSKKFRCSNRPILPITNYCNRRNRSLQRQPLQLFCKCTGRAQSRIHLQLDLSIRMDCGKYYCKYHQILYSLV